MTLRNGWEEGETIPNLIPLFLPKRMIEQMCPGEILS